MAVVDQSSITPAEVRRRLAAAGYDMAELGLLSKDLQVDLLGIMTAWAPILIEVFAQRRPWWKRLFARLAQ